MIDRHGAHGRAGAAAYLERQAREDEPGVHHLFQVREVLHVQHLALPAHFMGPVALVAEGLGGIDARRVDADVDAAPVRKPVHPRLADSGIGIQPVVVIPAVVRLVVARPDEHAALIRHLEARPGARLFQVRRLHPVLGVAEFREVEANRLVVEPLEAEFVDGLPVPVDVVEGVHVAGAVVAHDEAVRGRGMARGRIRIGLGRLLVRLVRKDARALVAGVYGHAVKNLLR